MSTCVTGTCPHGKSIYVWLPGGPWYGDPSDPDHGKYRWVHSTVTPGSRGRHEVCTLTPFATPAEAGQACEGCGHDSYRHEQWPSGAPIPHGKIGPPDPGKCADCNCEQMRYRPGPARTVQPVAAMPTPVETLVLPATPTPEGALW